MRDVRIERVARSRDLHGRGVRDVVEEVRNREVGIAADGVRDERVGVSRAVELRAELERVVSDRIVAIGVLLLLPGVDVVVLVGVVGAGKDLAARD